MPTVARRCAAFFNRRPLVLFLFFLSFPALVVPHCAACLTGTTRWPPPTRTAITSTSSPPSPPIPSSFRYHASPLTWTCCYPWCGIPYRGLSMLQTDQRQWQLIIARKITSTFASCLFLFVPFLHDCSFSRFWPHACPDSIFVNGPDIEYSPLQLHPMPTFAPC